jgi:diacylglycerol kinase (ATP)
MPRKLAQSFRYAGHGVKHALATQRNIRFHMVIALIVIIFGYLLKLSTYELAALAIAICFVIVSEMINTSIEEAINLMTTTHRAEAKIAKDVAAGAVLFSAVCAIIVGCLIFIPHIINK